MAPLPPLKPMAQSRRGVTQMLEAQAIGFKGGKGAIS
jgi:hypothetical protein